MNPARAIPYRHERRGWFTPARKIPKFSGLIESRNGENLRFSDRQRAQKEFMKFTISRRAYILPIGVSIGCEQASPYPKSPPPSRPAIGGTYQEQVARERTFALRRRHPPRIARAADLADVGELALEASSASLRSAEAFEVDMVDQTSSASPIRPAGGRSCRLRRAALLDLRVSVWRGDVDERAARPDCRTTRIDRLPQFLRREREWKDLVTIVSLGFDHGRSPPSFYFCFLSVTSPK